MATKFDHMPSSSSLLPPSHTQESNRPSRPKSPISHTTHSSRLPSPISPRPSSYPRQPSSPSFPAFLMSRDDAARKRPRERSLDFLPPILSPWEDHPDYGIVHPSGCEICSQYMSHISEASYSDSQPSLQIAFTDRANKLNIHYFDGVKEGRRRQRGDDEHLWDDLERYRSERNEALEELSRYRIDYNNSRDELEYVREKLLKSQSECEQLRLRVDALDNENQAHMNSEALEVQEILLNSQSPSPTLPERVLEGACKQHPSPTPETILPKEDRPSHDVLTGISTTQAQSVASTTLPPRPTTYAAALAVGKPQNVRTSGSVTERSSTNQSPHPTGSDSLPSADLRAIATQSPTAGRSAWPKTLRQLQSLMNAAHQTGNPGALVKVKALCAQAHGTPREQKTDLQRYLLTNWRNPTGDVHTPSHVQPAHAEYIPMTNPRTEDPVDVWYAYLCHHHTSWPRGVRRDFRGRPNMSDLTASRIVARLRPVIDSGTGSLLRASFMTAVTDLFCEPGTYKNYLQTGGYVVAPQLSYKPLVLPDSTEDITIEDVALHFAACGVTYSSAAQEIEPWAREYRASAASQSSSSTAVPPNASRDSFPSDRSP